jgi:ribosomal RNA assembly protein
MIKIISEKIARIIKAKKQLEKVLNIKIENRGKEVSLKGLPEDEYISEKVIDAINLGFPIQHAILIKTEDLLYEKLNIKEHTKRKDFKVVRSRIIGTNGKTLRTVCQLTDCYLEIKDNTLGIIGAPECIRTTRDAIISLIRGTKQANIYGFLEKHRIKPILDLGLRETKKKKD